MTCSTVHGLARQCVHSAGFSTAVCSMKKKQKGSKFIGENVKKKRENKSKRGACMLFWEEEEAR